ncbi:unnamed protein product, partial [Polarella glacialis]
GSETSSQGSPEKPPRRAASAPPRPWGQFHGSSGASGRSGSGSPPPFSRQRRQLSTAVEHATPPRNTKQLTGRRLSTAAQQAITSKGKENRRPGHVLTPQRSPGASPAPNTRPGSSVPSGAVADMPPPTPRMPGFAPAASTARHSCSSSKLAAYRTQRSSARHLAVALGEEAKDAFKRALLQGVQQPRSAKLGFVGAARAGKTSTLRALAGLALRPDEESTPGLALWELSQELLSASPGHRWQLQDARAAAGAARWDGGVAKYVADCVRPSGVLDTDGSPSGGSGGGSSSSTAGPRAGATAMAGSGVLDASVMKRMPVDLIARRLGEKPGSCSEDEQSVVLEAYDFGGQEVYYSMHHLFLTDYGMYLACLDLSKAAAFSDVEPTTGGDSLAGECAMAAETWEALEWWLASLAVHAPNSPVAIVGTHDDCLTASQRPLVYRRVHERIAAFCSQLPELNEQLQVNEAAQLCFFPLDNSGSDGGASIAALRSAVEAMASGLLQGPLGAAVPLRWGHFWSVLQRATSASSGPLLRVEEIWRRSVRYGFESPQELQRFLRHFRGLGALLYFPEAPCEELKELVCLNPAWVAEAAAGVLTAKDKVLQGCTRHAVELRERGLLHAELLSGVWRHHKFARHQRQLVSLLQVLDLLMPWGHDRQCQLPAPRQIHLDSQQLYLVPSLLPVRPQRQPGEARTEQHEEDAIVLYLDFHGLLHRLLPTLLPRLLCTLHRMEAGAQILSVYANFALFTMSTQGQAKGDSARSQGGRRHLPMLLVSLQPCAGGEHLRCCLRPRRSGGEGGPLAKPSWRHVERLLHGFRDAVAASWICLRQVVIVCCWFCGCCCFRLFVHVLCIQAASQQTAAL